MTDKERAVIEAAQTIRHGAYLCLRCQCSVIAKLHMQKLIDALAALDAVRANECPTCHGCPNMYRGEHGHDCPDCTGRQDR